MHDVPRVAFYSHDTFGLGHLRRTLNLASAFGARNADFDGLILTGSPWSDLFAMPRGVRVLSLPAVVKTGADDYSSRDDGESLHDRIKRRRELINRGIRDFAPDLLVVDNVPRGLCDEILPALSVVKSRPGARCILSLRDILDERKTIAREWDRRGARATLRSSYDEVWVFGDETAHRDLTARGVLRNLPLPVRCCGLVAARATRPASDSAQGPRPRILVTGGGGGDAGALIETCAAMQRRQPLEAAFTVCTGPNYPGGAGEITPIPGTKIERFLPDLASWIAGADLVVSMAGYNTVAEILQSGTRAVLVPRVAPRREQWLRAVRLAEQGRADVIHPANLTPQRLRRVIERSLRNPAPSPMETPGAGNACRWADRLLTGNLALGAA